MQIRGRDYSKHGNHVYIMGILNLTPDSFSDGSRLKSKDDVLFAVEDMLRAGVDVVDLGAESTRPGAVLVSKEEETERLLPIIEMIRAEYDVPISVDTYKAEVMDAAFSAGADLANDIWGFRYEELHPEDRTGLTMAEVVAKHKKPAVLMHNDLLARSREERTEEQWFRSGVSMEGRENILLRVRQGLSRSLQIADAAGIPRDRILLDPGIGFAKTGEENQKCLAELAKLKVEGCDMLLGASRKSVIGDILQVPPLEREEGTIVTSVFAAEAGYSFVRVHDVSGNRKALDFWEKIRSKTL